jgi:hypothetical protein
MTPFARRLDMDDQEYLGLSRFFEIENQILQATQDHCEDMLENFQTASELQ